MKIMLRGVWKNFEDWGLGDIIYPLFLYLNTPQECHFDGDYSCEEWSDKLTLDPCAHHGFLHTGADINIFRTINNYISYLTYL